MSEINDSLVPPEHKASSIRWWIGAVIVVLVIIAGVVFWLWYKGLIGESFASLHRRALSRANYQVDVTDEERTYTILRNSNFTRITSPAEPKLEIYQDLKGRTSSYFDRDSKQYYQVSLDVATANDLLDPYLNYDISSGRAISRDKVGTKEVRVFSARDLADNQEITLWVDPSTGLILKLKRGNKTILSAYSRFGEIKNEEVTLPKDAQKVEAPPQT